MRLFTASGEPVPRSAFGYFADWSIRFHGDPRAKSRGGIPNYAAMPGIWKDAFPLYEEYKVARDWAELCRAPFPLPIDQYVFGLVQRWPKPADGEQATKDYQTLLTTFGKEQVFAAARKVQAGMDQEGNVTNLAAFGVVAPSGNDWNGLNTNPYEVLWTFLTKDDPRLAHLHQFFKDRQMHAFFGRRSPPALIEKDMQTDARTYRWVRSIPDLSTFRTFTDTEGIVHESIQMETSAQENSGKRHHAFVQMDISYRNEVPPSILSMDLRVLKGRSRLSD